MVARDDPITRYYFPSRCCVGDAGRTLTTGRESFSYLVEMREGEICEQLTSVGPVRASLHSTADSFITILGSSHDTAKYIDITIDCNRGDHGFTTGNFPHLGFVINVANLLNHKSEVVVPRQRFI